MIDSIFYVSFSVGASDKRITCVFYGRYVDYTQIYSSLQPGHLSNVAIFHHCMTEISNWKSSNVLNLFIYFYFSSESRL